MIPFTKPGRSDAYNETGENAARAAVTDGTRQRKELLNASLDVASFRRRMKIEMRAQVISAVTTDHLEARLAFADRRTPRIVDK